MVIYLNKQATTLYKFNFRSHNLNWDFGRNNNVSNKAIFNLNNPLLKGFPEFKSCNSEGTSLLITKWIATFKAIKDNIKTLSDKTPESDVPKNKYKLHTVLESFNNTAEKAQSSKTPVQDQTSQKNSELQKETAQKQANEKEMAENETKSKTTVSTLPDFAGKEQKTLKNVMLQTINNAENKENLNLNNALQNFSQNQAEQETKNNKFELSNKQPEENPAKESLRYTPDLSMAERNVSQLLCSEKFLKDNKKRAAEEKEKQAKKQALKERNAKRVSFNSQSDSKDQAEDDEI